MSKAAYIWVIVVACGVNSLRLPVGRIQGQVSTVSKSFGTAGGQCWSDFEFEGFQCEVLGQTQIFNHLGDFNPVPIDDPDSRKRQDFNLNVGRALETLRRELPMVFMVSELDFSIFAPQITVSDGNNNRLIMQRSLYSGIVKSLRLASSFSFVYPSMNVKKIEYIEDCSTIQCQVDVVLPDSVRVDGQAVWEGMFYFGLDSNGLIETHIFDRKISNFRSSPLHSVQSYPWLRANVPKWSSDLVPSPQYITDSSFIESIIVPETSSSRHRKPKEVDVQEVGSVLDLLSL